MRDAIGYDHSATAHDQYHDNDDNTARQHYDDDDDNDFDHHATWFSDGKVLWDRCGGRLLNNHSACMPDNPGPVRRR